MEISIPVVDNYKPTFKEMKHILFTVVEEARVILALEGLEWPPIEYATFTHMCDISEAMRKNNPTRKQMLSNIVEWVKFYRRLLACLTPDNPMRIMGEQHLVEMGVPSE